MKKNLLLTKAKRKIIKLLKSLIYHNYSYRPTGIYQTSKEYITSEKSRQGDYVEIYPDLKTDMLISEELYQACSDYLKPDLHVKTTYVVVAIPNGRVHTDNATSVAVISQANKLIADVSFSYKEGKIIAVEHNNIFRQRYFTKPERYKGTVFTLLTGGSGIGNYCHWLVDVLPRIHLLKESGWFDKVDYFLVPAYRYDFQKQSLKMLGIGEEKIIAGDKHTHIEADLLIASSAPRGNSTIIPYWLCGFLRSTFMQESLLTKQSPELIYISRQDSRYRNVTNEQALIALLSQYGFKTYVLSNLSFPEKISLFASAQVVVAATGAGLTNIVFCRKDTKIIEIFNKGFVVGPFYDLAPKVELEYNYLICETGSKARNPKEGQEEDVLVDLKQVRKMLNKLLITQPHTEI